MEYKLLEMVEQELYDEAKRITSILYDENCLCLFDMERFPEILNPLYKYFGTDVKLRVMKLCDIKHSGGDYNVYRADIPSCVKHHKKYINYKIELSDIDLYNVVEKIAADINKNKYKGKSIFTIVPKLAKKYINGHFDSVDYIAIIMILDKALEKYNIKFNSTTLDYN